MRLAIRLGHQVALHMRWRRNNSPSDLTKSSACTVWLVILKEVMMVMMVMMMMMMMMLMLMLMLILVNLVNFLVNLKVRNNMMMLF